MRYDNPFEALHLSMANAASEGLDDYLHFRRNAELCLKLSDEERKAAKLREPELGHAAWPGEWLALRPVNSQIEVAAMFMQMWGSTTLGFGGMGGAAGTAAYTVVLKGPAGDLAVYFGGKLAYKLAKPLEDTPKNARFREDLAKGWLAEVSAARKRYGAKVPARKKTFRVVKAPG